MILSNPDGAYVRVEFEDRSGIDYYKKEIFMWPKELQRKNEYGQFLYPVRHIKGVR